MDKQITEMDAAAPKRAYVSPTITVMEEEEVLSAFQVTVAAISWWLL